MGIHVFKIPKQENSRMEYDMSWIYLIGKKMNTNKLKYIAYFYWLFIIYLKAELQKIYGMQFLKWSPEGSTRQEEKNTGREKQCVCLYPCS